MRNKLISLFSFLLIFMIIGLLHNNILYTGHATLEDNRTAEQVMNDFASHKAFKMLGNNALFCIVIQNGTERDYFVVAKHEGEMLIKKEYCADPGKDNVIVKFNSYQDFYEAASDPKDFIINKRNTGYYIFPSNYVLPGGEVQCKYYFQMGYCRGLHGLFDGREISALGLPCCADFSPAGMAFGFVKGIFQSFWIILIILGFVIVFLLIFSRKKKIKNN